jgi:alpha-N-arabinofuranosidase
MQLAVELRGLAERQLVFASQLHHGDLKARNTRSAPDNVSPKEHPDARVSGSVLNATLQPLSWNVFVTEPAAAGEH